MTLQEFITSMQKELEQFRAAALNYQEKGELPDDLEEGDWLEQWWAFTDVSG
jgi:hypothetical protein